MIAGGKTPSSQHISGMSTVVEIETALKELPLEQTKEIAQWLEKYLQQQNQRAASRPASGSPPPGALPDYATRRRMIFGEKVLPNMILAAREEERWPRISDRFRPNKFLVKARAGTSPCAL